MRIYLIDNEYIVIKTVTNFLKNLGHEIVPFSSTSELFDHQIKKNSQMDVIIIDLKVSKEIGLKTIRKIHEKYPYTDIIIMSSILPFQEAFSYRVYAYLKKPIHFDELVLILSRLAERHKTGKIGFLNIEKGLG